LLRSTILMSQPGSAPKTIIVTSAIPGEGKSTVSRGLAAMLAMHNARVLLIDSDLHRPTQSIQLGLKANQGLSDVLSSSLQASDVIIPVPSVEGLFLLPAGKCPPQPATLLSSSKMGLLIEQAKQQYDFVIIDSPPVLRVSDTILLTPLVDVVLLVVRQNLADVREVRQPITMLVRGHGNLLGFAMNAVTRIGAGYDSYYQNYGNYNADPEPGGKA